MVTRLSGACKTLAALALVAAAGMTPTLAGCGPSPCERLHQKVCEELKDKRRCKIMEDEDRRAHLSDEACERMLKQIRRR